MEIVTTVWSKGEGTGFEDSEDAYRHLCALAVKRCVERSPQLFVVLDKRYTNPRLRDLLVERITSSLGGSVVLVLEQSESRQEKALQVADAVAWGIFQKHERGDETFYDTVREKIVLEEVVGETKNWPTLGADSHRSEAE